jgi:uncharacterized membrane protein
MNRVIQALSGILILMVSMKVGFWLMILLSFIGGAIIGDLAVKADRYDTLNQQLDALWRDQ